MSATEVYTHRLFSLLHDFNLIDFVPSTGCCKKYPLRFR